MHYASANTDELAELWNASVRAKAVYGDVMAGQEELDAAKAELESAQNVYLKKVTGCKETLTEEIRCLKKSISQNTLLKVQPNIRKH